MDSISSLWAGFQVALTPTNLFFCFVGVFIGTLVGVLPGIGPPGALAMLLPVTIGVPPTSAIIMLAGIYYGAQYGGSTTSILVNIPGEASSIVTCIDGYQMARQGRAGPALGISAIGSFVAGTLSLFFLCLLAHPMTHLALRFGPAEFFGLMMMGLIFVTFLSSSSMTKSLISMGMGLILTSVGMDIITGKVRFGFGSMELANGIGLIPLAMGLFGLGEVLLNLETKIDRKVFEGRIKGVLPNKSDLKVSSGPILRGSILGFFLGVIPGGGALLASFFSYAMEKKLSKTPERFGKGAIEGVAGPESANNSGAGGAFVPLFTLGIPSNSVMAMLLGAFILYGIVPGPLLMNEHPEIVWGTIASMYIGNVMLLILNLPLIGLWIQILKVPYHVLYPVITFFMIIGSYSLRNSFFDVLLLIIFGVLGYLMKKFQYDAAPLVLAFVLGDQIETAFRQALIISAGKFSIFVTRPIAATFLLISLILLLLPVFSWIRGRKSIVSQVTTEGKTDKSILG